MNTGDYLEGTHPDRSWTGQENLVRIIVSPIGKFAYARNGSTYRIDNHSEYFRETELSETENYSTIESSTLPFLGFEFGDHIPEYKRPGKELDKNYYWVFCGASTAPDYHDTIRIIGLKPNDPHSTNYGTAMPVIRMLKEEFIQMLGEEKTKKLTVYYYNKEGAKTKANVDSLEEIEDLAEILYTTENEH